MEAKHRTEVETALVTAICKTSDVDALREVICELAKACLNTNVAIKQGIVCFYDQSADIAVKHGRTCGDVTPYDVDVDKCTRDMIMDADLAGGYALGAVESITDWLRGK